MKLTFAQAMAEMRAGQKVRRESWGHSHPSFLVLIPGRWIEVSFEPMKSHVGEGAQMFVSDHIDAIFESKGKVFCAVGYNLSQEDLMSDDWMVVH